jgi:Haem-binding domain
LQVVKDHCRGGGESITSSKNHNMLKRIFTGLLIILILAQFFQPSKNNGEAQSDTDIAHVVPVPDTVMALLKIACYDCHSDSTRYPWYNHITPVNWWLKNHIDEGKRHLNYSQYSTGSFKRKMRRLEETAEQVEKHEMPIGSYLWIHKGAKLTDAQRKLIIDWANTSRQQLMQDSIRKASIM